MSKVTRINKRLNALADCIAKEKDRIEVSALNAGFVPMVKRIFGQGVSGGGYAIDGSSLGEYSEPYFIKRLGGLRGKGKKVGINRQKNLVFNGNLRASIQHGVKDGKNVIGFTNKDMADIANYQETSAIQVNKPIFGFNEFEASERDRVLGEEIKKLFEKCLKQG